MVLCLVECGLSALTVTHKERGQNTGMIVWHVVCDGVVWTVVGESVGRRAMAWWIEMGERME